MRTLGTTVLAALALSLYAPGASAQVSNVMAYDGYVESDGAPVNGAYGMRFNLYDAPEGGTQLFTEEWSAEAGRSCASAACEVSIYNGEFRVLLGAHADLAPAMVPDTSLFLGVEIRDNEGVWIALGGRQSFAAAPYALWSAATSALTVGGDLDVDGDMLGRPTVTATGSADFDSVDASGRLAADSARVDGVAASGSGFLVRDGDFVVDGNLTARNFIHLSAEGTDNPAFAASGSNTRVNPSASYTHTVIAPTFEWSGTLTLNGELIISDRLRLGAGTSAPVADGDRPLIAVRHLRWGTGSTVNSSMSTSDWYCWVGGHYYVNGNFDQSGGGSSILEAYAYESGGTWRMRGDMRSEGGEHERHEATLVCTQRSLVTENATSWFE